MKHVTETDFYLDKPKMLGVRGWSLLIPSVLAAIGFCAFAVLAFSFTELQSLPETFRRALVIVGSFALATGGEMGTLSATIEIFRKRKHAESWDWLALAISALATMAAFILSFAALLGVKATWGPAVQLYGPIVLGVLAAFDAYMGFAEVGMYLSTYDNRMAEWEQAFNEFRRSPPIPSADLDATDMLLSCYRQNPRATQAAAAEAAGKSRSWVGAKLAELETAGTIRRNGHGVEVLCG